VSNQPKRIIEAAIFEGDNGPISAQELVAMPESEWGLLRDMITDHRNGGEGGVARCLACDSHVFIQSCYYKGKRLPYYIHYKGADENCPWFHGKNKRIEDLRASQYQGRQESPAHRSMCEKLAEVVQLDKRYVLHRIDKYYAPIDSSNDRGRYPDVYVEWEGYGPFAIEFQLSNTFQTEVSQRSLFYKSEDVPLIWILYGIDGAGCIPQCFRDVIRRHRGNAFVFDNNASKASFKEKTLMLSCYLMDGDNLVGPELVRFDELTIPDSCLPYYEDKLIAPRLKKISANRLPWFNAFKNWDKRNFNDKRIQAALKKLPYEISNDSIILIAAAFSIVATASKTHMAEEKDVAHINYASRHGNVKAMLNSYLQNDDGRLAQYIDLLTVLLNNTTSSAIFVDSVKKHFSGIRREQATEDSNEWKALKFLLPEALDARFRLELSYCKELPKWAAMEQIEGKWVPLDW